ncbi:MAG TPA: hypothetical protein PKW95_22610 [bacterium]|nr:hypothetical protein [bacterium]
MLRKFIFSLFFLCLLFSFAACGDDDDDNDDADDDPEDGDFSLDDDDSEDDDDTIDDDDPTPPEGWRLELVDGDYAAGYTNVIALTSTDSPVIYYAGEAGLGDDYLTRLAVKNAASWQRETISRTDYVRQPAVIVDANDHFHVAFSYWEGYTKILEYRHNVNGDWTSAIVAEGDEHFNFFSMALDSAANAHFVYEGDDYNLYYGSPSASGWDFSLFARGVKPAVAVDGNDIVHIVYNVPLDIDYPDDPPETAGKIYHLHNADGEWTQEIVDELADDMPSHDPTDVFRLIVKVDDDDRLHLAYIIKYEKDYAEEEYSYWTKYATTDDEGEWICNYLSNDKFFMAGMGLDADATPFVLAADQIASTFSLFVLDGWNWQETPLELERSAADLAIDAQGYAHVSYATTYHPDTASIHLYYLTNRPE